MYFTGLRSSASLCLWNVEPRISRVYKELREVRVVRVLLCSCDGSQTIDAKAIAQATGHDVSPVHRELCGAELDVSAAAIEAGDVLIACGQQAALFAELAEDLNVPAPQCVDIRDRAGWSDDTATAPKMSALLTEARVAAPMARMLDIHSDGVALIVGPLDVAIDAATRLRDTLSVTVLATDAGEGLDDLADGFQIVAGQLRRAAGSFGRFEVVIDHLREVVASGRGAPKFGPPNDGAVSECDVIIDLRNESPLFPADHKRDGYFRVDANDAQALNAMVVAAGQMVGSFEKPLYVRYEESLCAHSRAQQTGCTRCLDICPTGAIVPDGDHVAIDAGICAGCGACSAVCPSGAASYEDPPVAHLYARMRALAEGYAAAGTKNTKPPLLLVHDDFGAELIRLAARHFSGLPEHVIPIEISALSGFGHAEILAAIGVGMGHVAILPGPNTERHALSAQIDIANAISGVPRVCFVETTDPETLFADLNNIDMEHIDIKTILPVGGRREVTRVVATALRGDSVIALPEGAPYGAVLVDAEACTLCLSCAGQCPTGALLDDEDHPRLRFREDACLQCGICASVCPEDAIALRPQLDLTTGALEQKTVKEEEPFACIECGKLFGVKSTIERIVAKLEGTHAMFTNSHNTDLIRMCDDCRVNAQFHAEKSPFKGPDRPRVRTTMDYLDSDES